MLGLRLGKAESASYREHKTLATALKSIYMVTSADAALAALDAFEENDLGMRYPDVVRRWRARCELVIPFLAFSDPIRKVLYTTNAIDSSNASVRRAVKVRGHFISVCTGRRENDRAYTDWVIGLSSRTQSSPCRHCERKRTTCHHRWFAVGATACLHRRNFTTTCAIYTIMPVKSGHIRLISSLCSIVFIFRISSIPV